MYRIHHREKLTQGEQIRPPLSTGQCVTLACLLEATTPKPGNVHRGCDFEDMTFLDFAVSAAAIGPIFDTAETWGVGATVLRAIQATRHWVATNTNLGTVLLIAPLACVPREQSFADGLARVLANLTAEDARQVYEAIRWAHPGGMGQVDAMDVAGAPPASLLEAMRAASERDLVARQYGNQFAEVLQFVLPRLVEGTRAGWRLTDTIIHTQLQVLASFPDSLIARKCGLDVAQQVGQLANRVLAAGHPGQRDYQQMLADLDFWLRADGHRRNPGTTADLIAAGLFVALRDGLIAPPFA